MKELAAVAILCLCFNTVFSSAGSRDPHPCDRPCVAGQTMTCRYNFTLEWFRTLGKGCYACPFNQTDCYRQECVAGDGFVRLVMAINRQVPGPAIQVCEGDTVEVHVANMLEDGLSTSLHWHGQHVFRQPYSDGAGGITQCHIHTGETFVYKFTVGPAGTHWYHAHTAMQLADGAFGPFVVRQTPEREVQGALYDLDLGEHVLMVYNWMQDLSIQYYLNLQHAMDFAHPQSIMVNGRARKYDVTDKLGVIQTNLTHAQTPVEVIGVEQGKRYRLRFIGASSACALQVSVDDHMLMLISEDGMPVTPRVVDAFIIHPGERYDFVLTANRTVGNYWLRVIGLGECDFTKATGMAIVRYQGAPETDPAADPSTQRDGVLLNPIPIDNKSPAYGFNRSVVNIDDLRSVTHTNYTEEHVDVKVYIGLDFNVNDNTKYNNKDLYNVHSLPRKMAHVTPVIDNITFTAPPVPLLSQREDVDDSWFCNRSTLDSPDHCLTEDLCMCVHTLRVPLNKVVEMVVFVEGRLRADVGHPMHLHGHNFRLLGTGKLGPTLSRSEVEEADRRGQLRRNFISPPVRDSVNVPDGGYVIFRFVADNPGYWFFHCHTDSHLQQGMAMLIKVGELSDLPPVPADFPRCGGMGYSNSRRPSDPCPTGAAGAGADPAVTAMVTALACLCATTMAMF